MSDSGAFDHALTQFLGKLTCLSETYVEFGRPDKSLGKSKEKRPTVQQAELASFRRRAMVGQLRELLAFAPRIGISSELEPLYELIGALNELDRGLHQWLFEPRRRGAKDGRGHPAVAQKELVFRARVAVRAEKLKRAGRRVDEAEREAAKIFGVSASQVREWRKKAKGGEPGQDIDATIFVNAFPPRKAPADARRIAPRKRSCAKR